jgi:hypothetical protein
MHFMAHLAEPLMCRAIAKFIVEMAIAIVGSMVFIPLYIVAMIFVSPLFIALIAWRERELAKTTFFLTVGSWPLWFIVYVIWYYQAR